MKTLFLVSAMLLAFCLNVFAQDGVGSVLTSIFAEPTGSKMATISLIGIGWVLYFIVMFRQKIWRIPSTVFDWKIWFNNNWPNIVGYAIIIFLVYQYSSATTFSVGTALMLGATMNLALDFLMDWITKSGNTVK